MQLVGLAILVAGYAGVYKAAQMLKRPPGGTSGSYLYWLTGVASLGAPKGGLAVGQNAAHTPQLTPLGPGGGGDQTHASGGVGLAK
jgi:hypothetical protein